MVKLLVYNGNIKEYKDLYNVIWQELHFNDIQDGHTSNGIVLD